MPLLKTLWGKLGSNWVILDPFNFSFIFVFSLQIFDKVMLTFSVVWGEFDPPLYLQVILATL